MAGATVEEQLPYVELCQRTYSLFEEVRYPTIAAIEGAALGGGLEVTLACDIRIAGRGAVLGVPEATIGLIAGAGGITRLTRVVGRGVALDLTLTGRRLSAEEALALNVVTRLAEQGQAAAEALALARHLADGPTEAIEASKRLAVVADQGTTAEALDREREAWATVRRSAKTQEGLEAFVERRAPDFRAAAARQAAGGPPAA
jgi:enoyl-CoA hydratase/carnithine racemase